MAESRNQLTQAGDYNLDVVEIISYRQHGGESQPYRMDIKDITMSIEVQEDIFSNTMMGIITVNDTQDVRTTLPITGLERLNLKFGTKGMKGICATEDEGFPFQIYKIEDVRQDKANARGQYYNIYFCSQEMYYSSIHRVSQAFSGNIEAGVQEIVRNKGYLNSKKQLHIEPTRTNTKLVIPNLRPLSAINFLAKNSTSQLYNNTGYVFYETPDGFHFRSLESLLAIAGAKARPVKFAYNYQIGNIRDSDVKNIQEDMKQVLRYDFERPVNALYNLREGMYCSREIKHDAFTKTWSTNDFDYNKSFGDFFHTEHNKGDKAPGKHTLPHAVFSDTNDDITTNASAKLMLKADNSMVHNDFDLPSKQSSSQARLSQRLQMRNIAINMEVHGNSLLRAGDLISFDLPLMRPFGEKNKDTPNPYFSGRYMILQIRHIIVAGDGKYSQVLRCMKDAVRNPYPIETDSLIINTPERGNLSVYDADKIILNNADLKDVIE